MLEIGRLVSVLVIVFVRRVVFMLANDVGMATLSFVDNRINQFTLVFNYAVPN